MHDSELPDYEPVINPGKRRASDWPAEEFRRRSGTAENKVKRDLQPQRTVPVSTATTSDLKEKVNAYSNSPILKRGHIISFFGLMLFTAFVYFRPYELFPQLSFLSSGAKWIATFTLVVFVPAQLGLEGNLVGKIREVNLVLLLGLTALLSLPMAISISEGWDNFTDVYRDGKRRQN